MRLVPDRVLVRIAIAALAAVAFGAAPAGAAQVKDVRVGLHKTFTRVVIETDTTVGYRIDRAASGAIEVHLQADANPEKVGSSRSPVLRAVQIKPNLRDTVATLLLRGGTVKIDELILANPPRIVLDLRHEGRAVLPKATPKPKAKPKPATKPSSKKPAQASAKPAAKPSSKPQAAAPKPKSSAKPTASARPTSSAKPTPSAKPAATAKAPTASKTDSVIGDPLVAERARNLSVGRAFEELSSAGAQRNEAARRALGDPADTMPAGETFEGPAKVEAIESAEGAKKVADRLAAQIQAAEKTKGALAEKAGDVLTAGRDAAGSSVADKAAQAQAAVRAKSAEARAAAQRLAAARPTNPAPKPSTARPTSRAPQPPTARPTPPTKPTRVDPPTEPSATGGGILAYLKSPIALGAVGVAALGLVAFLFLRRRSEPDYLSNASLAGDEPFSLDRGEAAGSAVGQEQEQSDASSYSPDAYSEGEDSEEKPDEEAVAVNQGIETGTDQGFAAPPGAGMNADFMRMVEELERRVSGLEQRLEETVEAKERLERQVAAQTEELRVQRSAIARTQRALRAMARPTDDEATEPVPKG